MTSANVTFVTGGSVGDVQPLVALARAVAQRGRTVRIVGHARFEHLASFPGAHFRTSKIEDPAQTKAADVAAGTGRLRVLRRTFVREGPSEARLRDLHDACVGSAAIVCAPISGYAVHLAEAMRVPAFVAAVNPVFPTAAFPSPIAPRAVTARRWPRALNRPTHWAMEHAFWQVDRPWANAWRTRLGLAPLSRRSLTTQLIDHGTEFLFGFSDAVLQRPPDWPSSVHVTGYWFLDDSSWEPPPDLLEFLSSGPPPVSIGFGSTLDPRPDEIESLVLEAMQRARVRAILTRGWARWASAVASDHLYVADQVPYAWLFPRVGAAVHHAGAGTCAEVLRAGIPSVGVPFFAEQRFWSRRLHELGVAPPPQPRATLTATSLAATIAEALSTSRFRSAAASIAARIAAENGAARAASIVLERTFGGVRPGEATSAHSAVSAPNERAPGDSRNTIARST